MEHACGDAIALREGTWKFIPWPKGGQLYNLARDPGESANLAASQPDRARSMAARVQRLRKDGHSRPGF